MLDRNTQALADLTGAPCDMIDLNDSDLDVETLWFARFLLSERNMLT